MTESVSDESPRTQTMYAEPKWLWRLAAVILVASLALVIAAIAAPPYRFYMQPFKEAQTAITVYYMQTEAASILRPPMPVFGQPWMLPVECPLFQKLVSWLPFGWVPQDKAGQIASMLCYLGAAWVLRSLLTAFGTIPFWRRTAVALFMASPVYLGFAGAYIIESFTLLLALLSLYGLVRWHKHGSWSFFALSLVSGILCALSKATTWAAIGFVLLAVGAHGLWSMVKARSWNLPRAIKALSLGILGALPVVGFGLWNHHAEIIRTENPLSAFLSYTGLVSWNYGTLEQKLSPVVWAVIICKNLFLLFGPLGMLVPVLLAYSLWLGLSRKVPGYWSVVLLCALYLVVPAIFTNLHLRHDYYLYANGVYLTVAVTLACELVWRAGKRRFAVWSVALLLLSTFVGSCGYIVVKRSFRDRIDDRLIQLLRTNDMPGPIAFLGFGWSPLVPYYTHRKALMVNCNIGDPVFQSAIRRNRDQGFIAAISMEPGCEPAARVLAEGLQISNSKRLEFFPGATLWLSEGSIRKLGKMTQLRADPVLNEIQARIAPSANLPNGIVYWKHPWKSGRMDASAFEVIVKRLGDAFYFRSKDWSFCRIRGYFRDNIEPQAELISGRSRPSNDELR